MKIDKETIRKARKCDKNFKCLTESLKSCCNVENLIDSESAFVNCNSCYNCPYKINFADEHACTCPVRLEFFKKYGL